MKKILALFILAFTILGGCQATQDQTKPSDESAETIIKEAPFHQGESDHTPQSESKKCIVACNTSCSLEAIDAIGCHFNPKRECYEKALCMPPLSGNECRWGETEESKACLKTTQEEIAEVNKRFDKNRENCGSDEWCTYEYLFRKDHFEFIAPSDEAVSFGGSEITTSYICDDGNPCFLGKVIDIFTDEPILDPSIYKNIEEIQVDGAKGFKYNFTSGFEGVINPNCSGYYIEYKDKFYKFRWHEACMSFGNEFSDSLRFY